MSESVSSFESHRLNFLCLCGQLRKINWNSLQSVQKCVTIALRRIISPGTLFLWLAGCGCENFFDWFITVMRRFSLLKKHKYLIYVSDIRWPFKRKRNSIPYALINFDQWKLVTCVCRSDARCEFVIDHQQDATFWFIYLYPIGSTCFVRYFRPSSGALDYIYSFWCSPPMLLPAGVMNEMEREFHLIHDPGRQ